MIKRSHNKKGTQQRVSFFLFQENWKSLVQLYKRGCDFFVEKT